MLVFDLGSYSLDSSEIYLRKGHKVVAVDANQKCITDAIAKYRDYVIKDKLICVNKAVTNVDNKEISFYIQPKHLDWCSIYRNIAERQTSSTEIKVKTISIGTLMKTYGVPHYLKIDIEGADILVIKDLKNVEKLPKFISAETECLGKDEQTNGLEILEALKEVGYTKFFLENQMNPRVDNVFNYNFAWMTYDQCCDLLIIMRSMHNFSKCNWSFWYDVIASY